ncbi:TetR/AcrR family transcriptional regulator [Granulosicoccus sp. 3-233]|uniref:TetR/AcrR family transcriptional regulator n=1 Tax=Granulosicoccus sp. 3-233 TaxID=3417969 RepID=UPI003D3591CE
MGRRSDHSREQLQEMIIEAALNLVRQRGVEKVTARQIATAVGYTPGMLYSVFINLQDIFLHVNQIGLRALHERCAAAQQSSSNPADAIRSMGQAYLQFAREHTHQFDLMFTRSIQHPDKPPPGLGDQIRTMFELLSQQLHQLRPNAPENEVRQGALALWSGVHGTAALRLSSQFHLESTDADSQIVDLLIDSFIRHWQSRR